jgi:hypothetical protein
MAKLRLTVSPNGHIIPTVLHNIGGTEVESLLEGVGAVELKTCMGGSILTLSILPQATEMRVIQSVQPEQVSDETGHGSSAAAAH